jgi:hypothetical protein
MWTADADVWLKMEMVVFSSSARSPRAATVRGVAFGSSTASGDRGQNRQARKAPTPASTSTSRSGNAREVRGG